METFKFAVCAAMACAVTAVFAWDVEHDEIARLTGGALPAEIRAFFSFEDFGVLTGNCHFPDMTESEPRRWRTVDDMAQWVDAEDREILAKAGCRGYWLHTEEGKAVVLTLLSRAFATGAHTKAAFYLSLLTHSVSDESALNHPTLGNYHRYTKFTGVQYPSRKIEPGAKNVFGFRSDGPVAEKARERLAKRRPFRGTDASFDDALLRFAVEAVRQGAYSAEKEGSVFFAPLPEATEALADLVSMQVDAIIDMAETAWRFRRADQPLPPSDFKQRSTKAAQQFARTFDPFRESVWAGLADARLDPSAPKGVVGVVCEPYGVRGDSYMTYAGKIIAAAAARTLRDNGYAIKALSFWQVDKEGVPSPDAMPILLLARGSRPLPAGMVKAVRAYLASGGRLVLVGGGDPENLTGFSNAFVKRGDTEVPASAAWAGANAGDWRKMSVFFDGKVYPQRQDANVDGYCKPRCLVSVDAKAPGVEPFAEFSAGGARFAVAARKGNVEWVPQYLLMPFLYTDETTADWAAQRLDAFGTRILLKAIAGNVRVTDTVNAGTRPVRIPQGAEAFEVERPRAHGGAVVNAADFGFSATNDLNAAAVMRALEYCRRTKASRLVLAPGTYNCFDPDHGLVVADMEDFTLDGAGATLVFRRPTRRLAANSVRVPHDSSVLVTNCQRCVVGNFSIDWDWKTDPLCDVGVVAATHVDEAENASYFDLELPDWPQGHPWYGRPMPIQTMTPINAERTRLTAEAPSRLLFGLTEGHFGTKMTWLSPHAVRVWPGVREPGQYAAPVNDHYYGAAINRQTVAQMRKGAIYRVFHYYYGKNGITMHSGRHVTVENVNVLGCFGMPIVVDGAQEYGEFRKVVVEPVPGRPCTGTSDGCHVARSKGHIKFIDCVIAFQNDDGLNIHDCFTLGVPDGPRRIRVTNVRGPEYLGAQPGNELELLAPNFRPLGWKGRLLATEGDCLVVDRDLPPLAGEHFLVFDTTFQSDHIVLRGCTFHDTHFREIVQPKHVTVEDCRFIRTGSGFKMGSAHSREFWCEGRGSRDVVIRRCTFEHDCTLADWSRGAQPVFETYVKFPRPKPYPPGNKVFTTAPPAGFDIAFHGDILVEKCRITDPSGPLFVGNPVCNLIFRDNEIVLTGKRKISKTTGSFSFGAARDVFITGNHYRVVPSVGVFEPQITGEVPGLTVSENEITPFLAEVPPDVATFDAHTAEKVPTALRCWSNRAHTLLLTNGTDVAEGTGRVFRVHSEGSATALIIQRECPLDETVLAFTYFIPQGAPVKSISAGLRVKEDGGRLTNIRLVPVRGRWHTERFPIARFMQGDLWRAGTARTAQHLEIGIISEHGAGPIDFDVSHIRLFRQHGPCSPLVRPMQLMGEGTFTRTFMVEGAPTKAWLMALGKPHFRVSVNGRAVGSGGYANAEGWTCHNGSSPVAAEYSLDGILKEGANTVELTVDAAKDAKGVFALGWVANGRQQVVVTDGDWTCNGKRATARALSESAKPGLWDIYPVRPPMAWCPRAERPDYTTVPSYRPVASRLQVHPEEGRWGTTRAESGRWFFKSPSGHPFFFYGMQTVNCFRQNYGYSAWARRTYPTEVAWAEDAVDLVQRLGFNGVGVAASAQSAFAAAARRGMLNLEYVGCADPGPFLVNAQGKRLVGLCDPFDPEWRRRLREMLARRAAKLNARPAVFGICVGNEAHIEGNFAGISQAGFVYSPACGAELVRWLGERYNGDVDALNRAWFGARTNAWFSSFADVLVRKPDPLGKGQAFGDAEQAAAMAHLGARVGGGEAHGRLRADFDAFSVHVVRTYASETLKLMREYFPDKLIGSNRFLGGATEEMYACWKDYDFIAVNSYPMMKWGDAVFTERQLDALRLANRATGRPVLLTEWGVQAMDVNLQSPAAQLYTQVERGRGYEKVLRQVVEELPFVAGVVAFGFQHLADSEGQGWGIVDNGGRPYLDYMDGMRAAVRWLDGFLSQQP